MLCPAQHVVQKGINPTILPTYLGMYPFALMPNPMQQATGTCLVGTLNRINQLCWSIDGSGWG